MELSSKGIQPENCNNMNKTGFGISIRKYQWIIIRDCTRPFYLGSSNNWELVKVIECVSVRGKAIAPMFILPRLLHQEQWFINTALDDNCLLATSESGYANNELSFEWL